MGEIILYPTHEDYCKECIYNNAKLGICNNEMYNKNSYKVNCVWRFCPYKKINMQTGNGEIG